MLLDVFDERPAKRQKIAPLTPESEPRPSSTGPYLTLAEKTFSFQTSDVDLHKALIKASQSCVIQKCTTLPSSAAVELDVRLPALQTTTAIRIDIKGDSDMDLLNDATKVPASGLKQKSNGVIPVACAEATLSLKSGRTVLHLKLLWHDIAEAHEKVSENLRQILARNTSHEYTETATQAEAWDVREFYDNVHVPSPEPSAKHGKLNLDLLQCQLYPFQERATRWLLFSEGVTLTNSGAFAALPDQQGALPLDFEEIRRQDGTHFYRSNALGVLTTDLEDVRQRYSLPKGGILAEAMGLGKTVEMLALICTHSWKTSPVKHPNSQNLIESRATLIITPPTILEQWMQEIRQHAPSLRVCHYEGVGSKAKRNALSIEELADQDIVLTTYSVIAREVHYVKEKPDRNLRQRYRPEPPKSALTQILWFRCLLDEAQMIESGVSNAATVARLIPRVNAWAVTGTPLKQSHRDLFGLLLFLKCEPWCQSVRAWEYLVFYHRPLLRQLISTISLRHSKEIVRHELRIPAQSRQTITIPFSAIEESHYTQLHHDMQEDCGFDHLGAPLEDDWDPESPVTIEKMRSWLQRLRQTCLHPEVGGRNRKALGRSDGPLRTVAQVLDVMIEQAESAVHTELRNLMQARVSQGRMFEHARASKAAQSLFREIYVEVTEAVEACRADLAKAMADSAPARDTSEGSRHDDDGMSDDEVELNNSQLVARQRLRSVLEIQHICIFFIGNTFFQLKEAEELRLSELETASSAESAPKEEATNTTKVENEEVVALRNSIQNLEKAETESYEEAKKIRSELLTETHKKAERRIRIIKEKSDKESFAPVVDLQQFEEDFGGIESRKVFEKFYHFCKALNEQGQQFRDMRNKMVAMLTQALVDEDEGLELTGEEYESSTKHQDEMYVVMEMLRALYADRNDAVTGQENLLLKQETKGFMREAKEGKGPAPELMIQLLNERTAKRIDVAQQGSLRGILTEIRSLSTSLEWQESTSTRARTELVIVERLLQHVQKLLSAQTKALASLEQEVNEFRNTMNARLSYYGALQQISDTVAPYGEEDTIGQPFSQPLYAQATLEEDLAAKKLATASSKRRYLLHLRDESVSEESTRICTICQFEFEVGTLTVCGHQFCKECITMWYAEHKNCPVCKRRLHLADFYDVTYKPAEVTVRKEEAAAGQTETTSPTSSKSQPQPQSSGNSIYRDIGSATMADIKNIEIKGHSYGSKVDTLCRHVVYLRDNDPGSKAIIFSQYRDFLNVLGRALRQNGIICSRFDDKDGIVDFKSNPASQCFLLHAKAHSAGLNLVVANHVILCEPLINTAIELQAIARVHRIGQHRTTTVWMYLIADTVEEAIYDISVKRRLAHMTENKKSKNTSRDTSRAQTPLGGLLENDIEAANSKELQAADLSKMFAAGKSGGEMVDKGDLWECLFGRVKRDGGVGVKMGLLNARTGNGKVEREVGRFVRGEAAERRREG